MLFSRMKKKNKYLLLLDMQLKEDRAQIFRLIRGVVELGLGTGLGYQMNGGSSPSVPIDASYDANY